MQSEDSPSPPRKPSRLRAYVVGASYMDVILHVDAYPKEDSKVRAHQVEKRRGGNGGNLLTVLSQFSLSEVIRRKRLSSSTSSQPPSDLSSTPAISLPHQPDVACEMVCVFSGDPPTSSAVADSFIAQDLASCPGISLQHCIFRGPGYSEPTAWIILTPTSRTVVNHTTVPEMTHVEFEGCVVKGGTQSLEKVVEEGVEDIWMHFEGRNVPEMSKMVQTLIEIRRKAGRLPVDGWGNRKRKGSFSTPIGEDFPSSSTNLHPPPIEAISLSPGLERKLSSSSSSSALHSGAAASSLAPLLPSTAAFTPSALDIALKLPKLTISIEFEKTNRPGLEELMPLADVLFFSKVYAEGKGFPGAPTGFFDNVRRGCKPGAILFLTWGEHGAFGLVNDPTRPARTFHCPAPPIVAAVDTIGAGDTFAAGIIYAMGTLGCDAMEAANWACRLATAKCKQVGFEGVAERVPLPTE